MRKLKIIPSVSQLQNTITTGSLANTFETNQFQWQCSYSPYISFGLSRT
jgi:hypothetical protein